MGRWVGIFYLWVREQLVKLVLSFHYVCPQRSCLPAEPSHKPLKVLFYFKKEEREEEAGSNTQIKKHWIPLEVDKEKWNMQSEDIK